MEEMRKNRILQISRCHDHDSFSTEVNDNICTLPFLEKLCDESAVALNSDVIAEFIDNLSDFSTGVQVYKAVLPLCIAYCSAEFCECPKLPEDGISILMMYLPDPLTLELLTILAARWKCFAVSVLNFTATLNAYLNPASAEICQSIIRLIRSIQKHYIDEEKLQIIISNMIALFWNFSSDTQKEILEIVQDFCTSEQSSWILMSLPNMPDIINGSPSSLNILVKMAFFSSDFLNFLRKIDFCQLTLVNSCLEMNKICSLLVRVTEYGVDGVDFILASDILKGIFERCDEMNFKTRGNILYLCFACMLEASEDQLVKLLDSGIVKFIWDFFENVEERDIEERVIPVVIRIVDIGGWSEELGLIMAKCEESGAFCPWNEFRNECSLEES
jgi:hypothetical protein